MYIYIYVCCVVPVCVCVCVYKPVFSCVCMCTSAYVLIHKYIIIMCMYVNVCVYSVYWCASHILPYV